MSHLIHVGNTTGDWEAVYVDGRRIYQGHEIYNFEWVHLINTYKPTSAEYQDIESEYLEDQGGYFPDNFNDIPKQVFV